jgi:hypothetical protein
MSRGYSDLSAVLDAVLASANTVSRRQADENHAIKEAAAAPRTDLARDLRALADEVRCVPIDVTYADLARFL